MTPILLSLLLAGPALALTPPDLADLSAAEPAALEAAAADASLSDARLAELQGAADWQVRQGAALVSAWREDADVAAELRDAPLVVTRARIGRVVHDSLGTPLARAVLADRLVNGQDVAADRLGLAHALAMDPEMDPVVLAGLISVEADPEVRAVLVWGWKESADAQAASAGLRVALSDPSPVVRTRAAEAAAYAEIDPALADALLARLSDDTPEVRARSARALGWKKVGVAYEPLTALLGDADPAVRLQALSALERIDAERTAALPQLIELSEDADPKVARLAGQLR